MTEPNKQTTRWKQKAAGIEVPAGYRWCAGGKNCAHPDGPVQPETEAYFGKKQGQWKPRCNACNRAYQRDYWRAKKAAGNGAAAPHLSPMPEPAPEPRPRVSFAPASQQITTLDDLLKPLGHEQPVRLTILNGDRIITIVGVALTVQSKAARFGQRSRTHIAGTLAKQGRIVIDTDVIVAHDMLLDIDQADASGQVRWLRDKLRQAWADPFDLGGES